MRDDAISRQTALDALDEQIEYCNKALSSFDLSVEYKLAVKAERASLKAYRETLSELPVVCRMNNDTISRQAAIDALWKALFEYEDKTEKQFQESDDLDVAEWIQHRIFVQNMSDIDRQTILQLPPAQPERKTDNSCDGCAFIGCYETVYPCAVCARRSKDYFTPTQKMEVIHDT